MVERYLLPVPGRRSLWPKHPGRPLEPVAWMCERTLVTGRTGQHALYVCDRNLPKTLKVPQKEGEHPDTNRYRVPHAAISVVELVVGHTRVTTSRALPCNP